MKRRQEAAEESERQRKQEEAEAKEALEAEARRIQAEAQRDTADAPGSPQSGRLNESGKFFDYLIKNKKLYIKHFWFTN